MLADVICDVAGGTIDEVLGQVVSVLGASGRHGEMIVMHEFGVEVVGCAVHEPVELVEPSSERPFTVGARGTHFAHRRNVPLAGREGVVAGLLKYLRDQRGVAADASTSARPPRIGVGQHAHSDGVVIASRQ